MLSLSRQPGETIFIGDEISIRVHSVKGNRVRLAVDAPRDIPISRSELLQDELRDLSIDDQYVVDSGRFA